MKFPKKNIFVNSKMIIVLRDSGQNDINLSSLPLSNPRIPSYNFRIFPPSYAEYANGFLRYAAGVIPSFAVNCFTK